MCFAINNLGEEKENISDFPFKEFNYIYEYYIKYGLYKERNLKSNTQLQGKINWKHTIEKSNKLVSNGNLVFVPIYSDKKVSESVFISECMHFVLDYSIEKLSLIEDFRLVPKFHSTFDYIQNRDFVIKKLNSYLNVIFKDINKNLLKSLISFFENLNSSDRGHLHVKIKYFELVWEQMMQEYLNLKFQKYCDIEDKIIFGENVNNIKFEKLYLHVDDSPNDYCIDPDHYAVFNNEQYIFDSKYYQKVKGLNYKQLAYGEIMKEFDNITHTYNVLLLLGPLRNKLHFNLNKEFITNGNPIKIVEQYVPPLDVMKIYTKV